MGQAKDAQQIQTNIVRVDGQRSVYLPILKQGGDSNTIAVVDGIRDALSHLVDVPKQLVAKVVFDQSAFVKMAIENLLHEGAIGLVLTGLMVLLFLGSMRATAAVFLSIPLSALAAFMAISAGGGSVNTMVLGGLALAFSRLIDNSVVVLENIFRHLEMGEAPEVAAEKGGQEVSLAVLAATLTTAIVFFPVVFLYGVSRFLFVALAMAVVLSLLASYVVAMTVVPLFCAKLIKKHQADEEVGQGSIGARFGAIAKKFNVYFERMLGKYDRSLSSALLRPVGTVVGLAGVSLLCLSMYPLLGVAFFPRTDPGQFVINFKAPSGTRIELSEQYAKQVEDVVRKVVPDNELGMIVSNIGITTDFSAIYTPNSAPHTGFVQVSLKEGHKIGSYEYMRQVRERLREDLPQLSTYFQSGGLVDSVLNMGMPAPIDVQVSGSSLRRSYAVASADCIASPCTAESQRCPGSTGHRLSRAATRYRPGESQPGRTFAKRSCRQRDHRADFERHDRAQLLGRSEERESLHADRAISGRCGEDHRRPETDSAARVGSKETTMLDTVVNVKTIPTPTEVDHYQLFRVIDVYVSPKTEDLGRVSAQIDKIVARHETAGRRAGQPARLGAEHEIVVQELRHRTDAGDCAGLPDSGSPVRLVSRSIHHSAGGAPGTCGCAAVLAGNRHHAECHVADGRGHDGGNRRVEQHSDRRIHAADTSPGHSAQGSRGDGIAAAVTAGADDVAGNAAGLDPHGFGAWHWQ